METLTRRGRAGRVLATAVVGVLVLAGTVWGTDDDFPFGPFLMYSSAPDPDADAPDTRVEGVDAAGRVVVMTESNSGLRRAEIEGQQQQYIDDPDRLAKVATAYHDRTPAAPELTEVRIVIRWVGVEDSRPTGSARDEVIARWTAS